MLTFSKKIVLLGKYLTKIRLFKANMINQFGRL